MDKYSDITDYRLQQTSTIEVLLFNCCSSEEPPMCSIKKYSVKELDSKLRLAIGVIKRYQDSNCLLTVPAGVDDLHRSLQDSIGLHSMLQIILNAVITGKDLKMPMPSAVLADAKAADRYRAQDQ